MTWSELIDICTAGTRFCISSHVSPDGDCIGSQLAIYQYLQSLGKEVHIFNVDPVPYKFSFLHKVEAISAEPPTGRFDAFFVIDCSNPTRLGWDGYDTVAPCVVNIDHHRDNTRFGHLNFVRPGAASGEIIFDFFTDRSIPITPPIAEALYAAILTDTGGFRFSNTNEHILRICAELVSLGINCAEIYENIYASFTPAGLQLQSRIWSTLTYHCNNRICSLELPMNWIDDLGAEYSDSEGMADMTTLASSVEVGMLIKHTEEQTHFSLRSKDHIDVGSIAKRIPGGGGHYNAAGCTILLPLAEALPRMLAIISEELG